MKRADTRAVELTIQEQTDLGLIRRELDGLVESRCAHGWDDSDREHYRMLCESERLLLTDGDWACSGSTSEPGHMRSHSSRVTSLARHNASYPSPSADLKSLGRNC